MTTSAWALLIATWSVILVATASCFARLLASGRRPHSDDEPT